MPRAGPKGLVDNGKILRMSTLSSAVKRIRAAAIHIREPISHATAPVAHSNWTLLAYSVLCLPWSLAGLPILVYLPAFYAQELHLSPGLVGFTFLGARIWDAFSDVPIGWLSDRTTSRFGRRKPWVIAAAPFLMLSTWFLCNPSQGAGLSYLAACAVLFYTSATAVGIPYISWGTELATDYVERTRVTSFRETFSMLGNLFFAAAPLVLLPSSAPLRDVLLLMSVTVLILVPLTTVPLCWVGDPMPAQHANAPLLKGLIAAQRDRVLLRFMIITFFSSLSNGTMNSLVVFALGVGLRLPNSLFSLIFIIYVATLCALPATFKLGRVAEKHHLLAGAMTLQAVTYAALALAPVANFPIVAIIFFVNGIANAAVFILPTSMLADVIDNGDIADGERRSGIYVAVYTLIVKLGLALGVGVAFGLLDVVDYNPASPTFGVADELNIRMLGFILPAVLLIPAVAPLLNYPITRRVQGQLRKRIESRGAVRSGE